MLLYRRVPRVFVVLCLLDALTLWGRLRNPKQDALLRFLSLWTFAMHLYNVQSIEGGFIRKESKTRAANHKHAKLLIPVKLFSFARPDFKI